jgi:hypothetical protein
VNLCEHTHTHTTHTHTHIYIHTSAPPMAPSLRRRPLQWSLGVIPDHNREVHFCHRWVCPLSGLTLRHQCEKARGHSSANNVLIAATSRLVVEMPRTCIAALWMFEFPCAPKKAPTTPSVLGGSRGERRDGEGCSGLGEGTWWNSIMMVRAQPIRIFGIGARALDGCFDILQFRPWGLDFRG